MNANDLQEHLLETIIMRYSKRSDAIDALAEQLNIGKDAIYRRLRGESLLAPKEIAQLARRYTISLDNIVYEKTDNVYFTFNAFSRQVNKFEDYWDGIYRDLDGATKLPEKHLLYSSAEIPIFLYVLFPEVIAFKMYVWARTVWDMDHLQEVPFSMDLFDPKILDRSREVFAQYATIPSTELWSLNIMDNTLHQIDYHLSINGFKDKNMALRLCDCLLGLADHMKLMAEQGRKFPLKQDLENKTGAEFNLYHNEMIYTNNTLFFVTPFGRTIYNTYGNPNFLKCNDVRLCDWTQDWFEKVISKSTLISTAGGEKGRNFYFERIRRRISAVRARLAAIIEDEY